MGGSLTSFGGLTSLGGIGSSKENALDRLLVQLNPDDYAILNREGNIIITMKTPDYFITNIRATDSSGYTHRAIINRLISATGHHYYRAWFGEAYD